MKMGRPLLVLCLFFSLTCPCFTGYFIPSCLHGLVMIGTQRNLQSFYERSDTIMVCSPGRSGSSLLTDVIAKSAPGYLILKSHLLPPKKSYKGKIVFIFSNPDKAAESALHLTIKDPGFGQTHFFHVETSDHNWLKKLGNSQNQNEKHNLLSDDALGCTQQLASWLHKDTKPCSPEKAQILAIKYEHLWEQETIEEIKSFLAIDTLDLPPKRERGYRSDILDPKEAHLRQIYNIGSEEMPIYKVYNQARSFWEEAPPYQYLNIRK